MSKYHNIITKVDGINFDSKKEARRYQELKLLQQGGHIIGLTLQPKFVLQKGFMAHWQENGAFMNEMIRPIHYIADFTYHEISGADTLQVVEDVKGKKTEVYELKKKMFLKLYGSSYDFREI